MIHTLDKTVYEELKKVFYDKFKSPWK
jgi:hypothetical protein